MALIPSSHIRKIPNALQAKYDFIDEMLKWSGADSPKAILDVGCGFGGTSRRLAAKFQDAKVEGITLSPEQVKRGTELAVERYGQQHFSHLKPSPESTCCNPSFSIMMSPCVDALPQSCRISDGLLL